MRTSELLALLVLAAAATAQDERLGGSTSVSPTPLRDADYSIELTERALNRAFASFAEFQRRSTSAESKLQSFTVAVRDGKLAMEGVAEVPIFGQVRFALLGTLELGAPDRFEYVLEKVGGVRLSDPSGRNLVKELALRSTKQILLGIFGIFTSSGRLSEYVKVSTNWAFNVPLIGPILGDRTVFIELTPKALPLLAHFHTVHLSKNERGRVVLQGMLREQPPRAAR